MEEEREQVRDRRSVQEDVNKYIYFNLQIEGLSRLIKANWLRKIESKIVRITNKNINVSREEETDKR